MAKPRAATVPPRPSATLPISTRIWRLMRGPLALVLALWCAATVSAQPNAPASSKRNPAAQLQPPAGARPAQQQLVRPPQARPQPAQADPHVMPAGNTLPPPPGGWPAGFRPEQLVQPEGLSGTLNLMVLLTVLSLAPSILIMTTCFVRFIIVTGLLRQALGTQSLPPNQVLIALSLFLTFLVMTPVWKKSYEEGIRPYTEPQAGREVSLRDAFTKAIRPISQYMAGQIERTGNSDVVWMLLEYQRPEAGSLGAEAWQPPATYEELGPEVLLPAFLLSEMKTAFLIGFQIFLPFLVIDMVVSAVLMSMGMAMLPPTVVSLPFKLLLFVLIDGWGLTVGMMLESVRPG